MYLVTTMTDNSENRKCYTPALVPTLAFEPIGLQQADCLGVQHRF